MRGVCASFSSTPHFKKLTEQEKRERGDNTVSLYETFAVLREVVAPQETLALSLVLSFGRRKKAQKNRERSELEIV